MQVSNSPGRVESSEGEPGQRWGKESGHRVVTTDTDAGKGSAWREAHTTAFRGDGALVLKKNYIGTSLAVQGL